MYTLQFHNSVEKDILEITQWYNEQKQGLGNEFKNDIFATLDTVALKPNITPVKYNHTRIKRINNKFPYFIHYEVYDKTKSIIIFGVFHGKRNPQLWKSRKSSS